MRMMSAVDPQKLTVSNMEILCHMTTVTLIIIGGIVSDYEKRDNTMGCTVRVTYGIDSTGHLQWNVIDVKERGRFTDMSRENVFQKEQVENVEGHRLKSRCIIQGSEGEA